MAIFVTGAAGYLGGELIGRAPGAAGSFFETPPPPAHGRTVQLDLRRVDAVERVLTEIAPDCVIHTAYRQRGPDAHAVNVDGSRALAATSSKVGARLIHVSTDLVFDGALGRPYTEEDEPSPVMEYGRQKLEAEHAVREEAPDALIVRTSLIYGGREPSPHERLVFADGVSFFTDELRSPVQVGDLAAALLELAASDLSGLLHVAGSDGISRHEFARLVAVKAGADPGSLSSGLAAEHPDPRPLDCRLDSSRATQLLTVPLRGAREVLAV